MFAVHMVHGMYPDMFKDNVSKFFIQCKPLRWYFLSIGVFIQDMWSHNVLFVSQEWELFTGMVVSDAKSDARGIPSWLEEDRAQPVALLQVKS